MRLTALAALGALTACLLMVAGATHPGQGATASTGAAAQQLFLDPVTGASREPTADELASLRAATQANEKLELRPGAAAPEEVHLPDGTVGIRLNHELDDTVVVCRQPDGHFSSDCPAPEAPR
jgi:hypothetical protein